jgi:hypothetical protein
MGGSLFWTGFCVVESQAGYLQPLPCQPVLSVPWNRGFGRECLSGGLTFSIENDFQYQQKISLSLAVEGPVHREEILTTVTNTNPDSLLEIALSTDSAGRQILELRRFSWGEGIGWYRQQTFQLDVAETEALLLSLRSNRRKWNPQLAQPQGKVIPFPLLAVARQQSRAPDRVSVEQKKERATQSLERPLRKGRNL